MFSLDWTIWMYERVPFSHLSIRPITVKPFIAASLLFSQDRPGQFVSVQSDPTERRLITRSHEISKRRYLCLKLPDCFEIWQASRQKYCPAICHISQPIRDLTTLWKGFLDIKTSTWAMTTVFWFDSSPTTTRFFLKYNKQHIARQWGWYKGYILWAKCLICVITWSFHGSTQYRVISNRVITAFECMS